MTGKEEKVGEQVRIAGGRRTGQSKTQTNDAGSGQPMTGHGFVASFMDQRGVVDIGRVADVFRMSKGQLAQTAGLGLASVSNADRRGAPRSQMRVTEMLEVISRVRSWAGGEAQAMAWYRSQPIPALDGRTPESLVKAGRAHAVREYLDHLALGGFA